MVVHFDFPVAMGQLLIPLLEVGLLLLPIRISQSLVWFQKQAQQVVGEYLITSSVQGRRILETLVVEDAMEVVVLEYDLELIFFRLILMA